MVAGNDGRRKKGGNGKGQPTNESAILSLVGADFFVVHVRGRGRGNGGGAHAMKHNDSVSPADVPNVGGT